MKPIIYHISLYTIKSIHFWAFLIFIIGTVFSFYYSRYWAVYIDNLDRLFAPMEWFFMWMIGSGVWLAIYYTIMEIRD